jgi:hypothetical protein
MEANVAQQQAEKAVILVQGSLILSQGLNDVKFFKRIIGDLATELLLSYTWHGHGLRFSPPESPNAGGL